MPRTRAQSYTPYDWPCGARRQLRPFHGPLEVDLASLLEQRQTRRIFGTSLSEEVLGDVLWLACRNRSLRAGPFTTAQESRPHPSAGGMHPIHVLVTRESRPWYRYEPVEHTLVELPGTEEVARVARAVADELVTVDSGWLIWLVSEPGKTAAKYERPESLVWRDAGVVLGYLSIVAEAMRLSFCPLGLLGNFEIASATSAPAAPQRLQGAGLAVLGMA